MEIINKHIDWVEMWKEVKEKHLSFYPTVEDYKEDHEGDLHFVEEMYLWLADEGRQEKLKDLGINTENEDTYIKHLTGSFNKYEILFNFGYAEDRSTENGYDDVGVEVNFWYDTDSECFVNFHFEQW